MRSTNTSSPASHTSCVTLYSSAGVLNSDGCLSVHIGCASGSGSAAATQVRTSSGICAPQLHPHAMSSPGNRRFGCGAFLSSEHMLWVAMHSQPKQYGNDKLCSASRAYGSAIKARSSSALHADRAHIVAGCGSVHSGESGGVLHVRSFSQRDPS